MNENREGASDSYDTMFDTPQGQEYESLTKELGLTPFEVDDLSRLEIREALLASGKFNDADADEYFKNPNPDRTTIKHVDIINFLREMDNANPFGLEIKALKKEKERRSKV